MNQVKDLSIFSLFLMLFMQMFVTSRGGCFARLPFGLTQCGASSLLPRRQVVKQVCNFHGRWTKGKTLNSLCLSCSASFNVSG